MAMTRTWSVVGSILSVLAWTAMAPAPALSQSSCPVRDRTPVIEVKMMDAGVSYDDNVTLQQLQALAAATSSFIPPGNFTIRGLTVVSLSTRTRVEMVTMSNGSLRCSFPSRVVVDIGYQVPQRVYLIRDFPVGSCQYAIVYDHENGHVRINKETLQTVVPLLEKGLREAMMHPGYPVVVPDAQWAKDNISASIEGVVHSYQEAHEKQRNAMNAIIDTPENYRRMSLACPS